MLLPDFTLKRCFQDLAAIVSKYHVMEKDKQPYKRKDIPTKWVSNRFYIFFDVSLNYQLNT